MNDNNLAYNIVAKLPLKVQPYAKMVVPLVLLTVANLSDLALSGEEWRTIVIEAGILASALVTYTLPNLFNKYVVKFEKE